ncbi:MAG TPA: hypothetical protein VJT67_03710 [Longimicrobiaceae bacterium]|nr:hypothetical protein [Longimicrobiaceae bacterium]
MRRSSAVLLAGLALAGCAAQHPRADGGMVSPAKQTIIGVEVTNTFSRSIDVYYSTQFLGTLAPGAHGSYTVPPAPARLPIYARWTGGSEQSFNISNGAGTVRYVYGEPQP